MGRIVCDILPRLLRTLLACGVLCAVISSVQAQIQITENPEGAVKLRRIWYLLGGSHIPLVGNSAGGLGDIDDDGFDDFSIRVGTEEWIYLGGDPPSDEPAFKIDSVNVPSSGSPIVGDFLGNGEKLIGIVHPQVNELNGVRLVRVLLYRTGDVDSLLKSTPYLLELNEQPNNFALHAADLDRDGADELVVVNTQNDSTRVRIYRGGQDFSLNAPTMTITSEFGATILVSDFDGDTYTDLILSSGGSATRMKFWWGSDSSPWNWTDAPDRVLSFSANEISPTSRIPPHQRDYNGDGRFDLSGYRFWADSSVFFLWMSDPQKDPRTRPFDSSDVTLVLEDYIGRGTLGYVADSLRRYHMLPLTDPPHLERDMYGLGGGAQGPNLTYDTWMSGSEGPTGGGISAGDVDGNGWEDRINFSSEYGGPGVGIAVIFAGGPYIPSDDPTVDVREIATDEHERAIHVWPNPVDEELRLAWRGDLRRQPARLLVHSMTGKDVADIPLHYWIGQARWSRGDASPGAYIITVLDTNGETLATTPIILR